MMGYIGINIVFQRLLCYNIHMLRKEVATSFEIKRIIKLGDVLLVLVLLVISFFISTSFVSSAVGNAVAVVMQDGTEIARIRLTGLEKPVRVPFGGDVQGMIVAENGHVHFEEANCPDQVCVHTGWLSMPGQIAACLPARVLVRIEGELTDKDVDIVLN